MQLRANKRIWQEDSNMHILNSITQLRRLLFLNKKNRAALNYVKNTFCSKPNKYELNPSLGGVSLGNYINHLQKNYIETSNSNLDRNESLHDLAELKHLLNQRKIIVDNLHNLNELLNEKDEDIRRLAEEERTIFENNIEQIDNNIIEALLPNEKGDLCRKIVLEVNTGVGGQEAMLFANELFEMYCNYAEYKGWEVVIADYATTELGGIRHGSALIDGDGAFRHFKHEAGVHRVQRIPATEKAGRIHTSTVSVLALPQPTDIEINIESKDLKIETKRASGAGGQHVNTTDSAVRIVHLPTGVSSECQVNRSQIKNKEIALAKLKAILYQQQLDAQISENLSARKSQVRSNFRNEKIRTYNFPQDRITDHRLQSSNIHNLKGFMQGGPALDNLIEKIDNQYRVEFLLNVVRSLNK